MEPPMSIQWMRAVRRGRQLRLWGVLGGATGWDGSETVVPDGSASHAGACDRGDVAGSGQGFAAGPDGHGVSVGGDSDSCGIPYSLRRSAEQKPGCGDAL